MLSARLSLFSDQSSSMIANTVVYEVFNGSSALIVMRLAGIPTLLALISNLPELETHADRRFSCFLQLPWSFRCFQTPVPPDQRARRPRTAWPMWWNVMRHWMFACMAPVGIPSQF
jgi:hypothetical protein